MDKEYRVGIVGCGGMGRSHALAWSAISGVKLAAVADVDEGSAQKLSDEFSSPTVFTDYKKMFENEELDIVSIPTWQGARAEITIAAAEAGIKGIIGEKPMAASLGKADDMLDACEKSGAKLAIGHNRRFRASQTEIRRLVADGAIGQPTMVYDRQAGGLLNKGTHSVDTWRYYLSDPEALWVIGQTSRTTDRWERRSQCEDLCFGLVCFDGGVRGLYEGDLPEPGSSMEMIHGTEGRIKPGAGGTILLQRDSSSGWQEIKPPPDETNQYQELIDWIEGRVPEHRSSGRQARHTIEVTMAIYESARTRDVVTMPLQTRESPLEMMIADGTLPVLTPGRYDIRTPFPEQK